MFDRLHRQLKAALKTQTDRTQWVDALPLILLRIWTAFKDDISATAAEMVYGTSLRHPGEIFNHSTNTSLNDPSDFVIRLKSLWWDQVTVNLRYSVALPPVSG